VKTRIEASVTKQISLNNLFTPLRKMNYRTTEDELRDLSQSKLAGNSQHQQTAFRTPTSVGVDYGAENAAHLNYMF
jgi:hypothetical protein